MNRRGGASKSQCSVDGCQNPYEAKGFCQTHYAHWRRYGDPLMTTKPPNGELMRWILAHLDYSGDDCLTWPFAKCRRSGSAQMTIKRKTVNPARVICQLIYGPAPSPLHEAAHSCGKGHKACVHPKHVRWASHEENEADKRIHGTAAIGVRHGHAKLSEAEVLAIRRDARSSTLLSEMYSVSFSLICQIRRRKIWRHLP